jgi:hypothetical protein
MGRNDLRIRIFLWYGESSTSKKIDQTEQLYQQEASFSAARSNWLAAVSFSPLYQQESEEKMYFSSSWM